MRNVFSSLICIFILFNCQPSNKESKSGAVDKTDHFTISQRFFGLTNEQDSVIQYSVKDANGFEINILNYGGIVTHLMVPDKDGIYEDVVLGYDHLEGYLQSSPYFGALVGRYGNRISKGTFTLQGTTYTLATNNGANHLHGGIKGFDKVIWDVDTKSNNNEATLVLRYLSRDMEEGYPGNLDVEVQYIIRRDHSITVEYKAQTDKATVVNLTQHSYFNLSGNCRADILDHDLQLQAGRFLPTDDGLIPTGEFLDTRNSPFDFSEMQSIGSRINDPDPQLEIAGGYDHCMIITKDKEGDLTKAATLEDQVSGRYLEVFTTEPAIQFYSGNFLDGSIKGKGGVVYQQRYGVCFEPQHYPDSPNQPDFTSTVLEPGETYRSTTVWKFGVR